MSKLTDQDIIKKELEKFENKQRSTLPSEIFDLPSGGLVYPKDHPFRSGKVEMRYMTAYDEDILTNHSYIEEGILFDKLLEALIVSDGKPSDLSQGDKDALIIGARIVSYGAEFPVTVQNPVTKKIETRTVNLRELKTKTFSLIPDDNGEFIYKTENVEFKFKYLSSAEINKLTDKNGNLKISELLGLVITEIAGERSKEKIVDFIKFTFRANDARLFREYILKNTPGLDMSHEFPINEEGDDGGTFNAVFQVGSDLFWA